MCGALCCMVMVNCGRFFPLFFSLGLIPCPVRPILDGGQSRQDVSPLLGVLLHSQRRKYCSVYAHYRPSVLSGHVAGQVMSQVRWFVLAMSRAVAWQRRTFIEGFPLFLSSFSYQNIERPVTVE